MLSSTLHLDEMEIRILRYLRAHEQGARRKEILNYLSEDQTDSDRNNTSVKLQDRLKNLIEIELVKKDSRSHKCVFLRIPRRQRERADNIIKRDDLRNAPEALVSAFHRLMERIEKDGRTYLSGYFQGHCITFIGDVPCTFPKSAEGLQGQIALENSLRQRHQHDLGKYHEEFMNARSLEERKKVDVRIREEVGWTVGEYFKKLLKKTEKKEGILGIFKNIFGISEEELREFQLAQYAAEFDRSTDFDRPECAECFEKGSPHCFRHCPRHAR